MMTKSAALLSALVFATASAVFAAPLAAKPLSRILAQSPLKPGDFDAMRAAEAALYGAAGVKTGSSVKWSNPETTARGQVKVTAQQGNCLVFGHIAYPGSGAQPMQVARKFCKSATGKWLLVD